jgi:hypothetical protein
MLLRAAVQNQNRPNLSEPVNCDVQQNFKEANEIREERLSRDCEELIGVPRLVSQENRKRAWLD